MVGEENLCTIKCLGGLYEHMLLSTCHMPFRFLLMLGLQTKKIKILDITTQDLTQEKASQKVFILDSLAL